ncbi:MAG: hypothetical protein ACK4E8_01240 [Lacibacter sp.]|jgi:hypothetical protein
MLKRSNLPLIFAVLLFLLLFLAGWPFYQYIFDSDAIGYLTVARHYAAGRWNEAINGYWSPLHSWLAAPFVAAGFYELYVFKALNGCIGILILLVFANYLQRYNFSKAQTMGLLLAAVVMVLHYAYYEVAADILLVLFLLIYFLIVTNKDFTQSARLNLLVGVVGAFAYFSKTYAFVFFLLHFSWVHLFTATPNRRNWSLGLIAFFALSLPWMVALSLKYDGITFGLSGKINWSSYLVHERNADLIFFKPPYPQSTAWWEDPYLYQKTFFTPFDSFQLFFHQIRVLLYNLQQYLLSLNEISHFAPFVLLLIVFDWLQNQNKLTKQLATFILLFPLGYLLIHIETRFIWIFGLLLLPWVVQWWQQQCAAQKTKPWICKTIITVSVLSFLAEPVNQLKDGVNKQKNWTLQAKMLQAKGIVGNSFSLSEQLDEGMIVAYQAGLRYYMPGPQKDFCREVLPQAKTSGIRWFLFFYRSESEKLQFWESKYGMALPPPLLHENGIMVFDLFP